MTTQNTPARDIGAVIDGRDWSTYQKVVLSFASLAFIVDALANQVMPISIPAMIRQWHVHRSAFSPVIAMGWVGVAIGAVLAGTLADRVGRKAMLLASILLFGVATAACAFVADIHGLLLLRMLDGVGIGGALPTGTTLIAEFTPAKRRSRAVNIGMISIPLGNLLCGLIGSFVLPHYGWRTLFLMNGAISVLIFILLLAALPESPRFLVRFPRRRAELLRGLRRLGVEAPDEATWVDGAESRQSGPVSALLRPAELMSTLGLWGAFFFCFLAVYTSLTWVPTLLSSHGYPLKITSLTLAVSGVGGMLGSVIMASLVERAGSRIALIVVTATAVAGALALTQMPLDPSRGVVQLMALLGVVSLALNALTGCIYALAAHVYPPLVKGTGLGAAGAVGRLGAITSSYAAVAVLAVGSQAYFGFIAATAVISLGFLMTIRKQIPSDAAFMRGATAAT